MIINSFLGIRNTSPPRSIPNNALTEAVNVDIDDAGIITKRNGSTLSKTIPISTVYSTQGQVGYLASAGTLYKINPDMSLVAVCSTTATDFYDVDETVFTNDGLVVTGESYYSINVQEPLYAPQIIATGGDLPAGTYSAFYVHVSPQGLESAGSPISTIEIAADGGAIQVITDAPPAGHTVKVYMTDAGGTVFYDKDGVAADELQIASSSFPSGARIVCFFNGSVYAAEALPSGKSVIWWSAIYRYQWWDRDQDYVIVPGEIRDMAATAEAIIIGTDAEIYALGSAGNLTLLDINGVPKGRSMSVDDGKVIMHTHLGVCEALPFKNVTDKKVSLAPGEHCSTAIVEQNGISRFVTLTDGAGVPYNARF